MTKKASRSAQPKRACKSKPKPKKKTKKSTKPVTSSKKKATIKVKANKYNSQTECLKATEAASLLNLESELEYLLNLPTNTNCPYSDLNLAETALGCSKNHAHLKEEVLVDCTSCLISYPDGRWKKFCSSTDMMMTNGCIATVPQFVKILSGEKTKVKIVLVNMLLLAWQAITRKKEMTILVTHGTNLVPNL